MTKEVLRFRSPTPLWAGLAWLMVSGLAAVGLVLVGRSIEFPPLTIGLAAQALSMPVGVGVGLWLCRPRVGVRLTRRDLLGRFARAGLVAALCACVLVGVFTVVFIRTLWGQGYVGAAEAEAVWMTAPVMALIVGGPVGSFVGVPVTVAAGWLASWIAFRGEADDERPD